MKILIMAAGRGTRISRQIHGKPKCCVEFQGEPLIQKTLGLLKELQLGEIGIVTGYQSGEVLKNISNFQLAKFYNPFFDVTNSIASLWFAKDFLSTAEDLIIINGDLFIERELMNFALEKNNPPVLMLADSTRIEDADYRFQWEDNILQKYGKKLSNEETTGEYVGIGRISKKFMPKFITRMHEMINSQQSGNWWEDIVYSLVGSGVDINITDTKGIFWAEVDYMEDFERIEQYLKSK